MKNILVLNFVVHVEKKNIKFDSFGEEGEAIKIFHYSFPKICVTFPFFLDAIHLLVGFTEGKK